MTDRGRVPFAVVGVLLLASSVGLVASGGPIAPTTPALDRASESATAASQTAVREAVRSGARAAARTPLVTPANTSAGRAVDAETPFRDALRLRIYHRVRDRLGEIERRRGAVSVTVGLPPRGESGGLEAARRHVRLERAGRDGAALRVRVENVTLTGARSGRTVHRRQFPVTVVLPTPVLAQHDRVATFQDRLDAGVTEPGLARRLSAQLYPLVWARAYAQYGGAPIADVLDNRHVAVTTNAALLDLQQGTVGHTDPAGRRTLAVAAGSVAVRDALAASRVEAPAVQRALSKPTRPAPQDVTGLDAQPGVTPQDNRSVAVGSTASAAYLDVLRNGTLGNATAGVYAAEARLVTTRDHRGGGVPDAPPSPGANWTLADDETTVELRFGTDVSPPRAPSGWHRLDAFGRTVRIERTRTRTWRSGSRVRRTTTSGTERVAVGVAVVGRHATSDLAPDRPIDGVHSRAADPIEGPNLAGVADRATDRLVAQRGGRRAILERAARGTADESPVRVGANRPDALRSWLRRDLLALRTTVRNQSVSVSRGAVGTFQANPPAALARAVSERRSELVSAPDRYESAAAKTRVAARRAYLDRVVDRLQRRADRRGGRRRAMDEALRDRDAGSLATLRRSLHATRSADPASQPRLRGPTGPVRLRTDAAPAYLTLGAVDEERVPAVDGETHPLAARTTNIFTVPYGDAADAVTDGVETGGEVRLATAARTLRALDRLEDGPADEAGREHRRLRKAVADGNDHLAVAARRALRRNDVGDDEATRRSIVTAGLSRWPGPASRALAFANGSAARSIAATAARRDGLDATGQTHVRLAVARAVRRARRDVAARPSIGVVRAVRKTASGLLREGVAVAIEEGATKAAERATGKSFARLPAGLPLAPVPGYWYATTNVWHVTVRGAYERFAVRAQRGRPGAPGGDLPYVRDGDPVRLDADGDGDRELLGHATRVHFDVSTAVVVVVPPGKAGVGDRDGNADERSPGWPGPGVG